jgi:hypothetical protein
VLPFGRLWYGEPNAIANAINYTKFYSRSHRAVIRVYDHAAKLIEVHRHKGDFKTMTVLIPLIVAAALGLAFAAYKHPQAYRVMLIFALPVLVTGGLLVLAIKIGDLNASIKSIYHDLQQIRKDALSDQSAYQIRRLYEVRQFLKVFLIYYISGFAYLVFLLFLPDLLKLAKDRHHTPT